MTELGPEVHGQSRRKSSIRTLGLVIFVAAATSAATAWIATSYLFPKSFRPVTLSQTERKTLDAKLGRLDVELRSGPKAATAPGRVLEPRRYSEEGASRKVTFSEREINALLAANTDLADKVAIDLSPGLVSARILLPIDPDMPLLGGKTLSVTAGLALSYRNGRPVVVLRGVSLWGVPIPNAWLGNLKNVDLVAYYGDEGFWHAFAAGVNDIAVSDGRLAIELKE